MTFRPSVLALLAALAVGQVALAAPACTVQTTAHLDTYQVRSGARGLLTVQVRCPDTGRYRLHIESDGEPLRGPSATLKLVAATDQSKPASVEIQGLPLDAAFSGTQRFDLTLWATPGQWQLSGGPYAVSIAVSAESMDAGALP